MARMVPLHLMMELGRSVAPQAVHDRLGTTLSSQAATAMNPDRDVCDH